MTRKAQDNSNGDPSTTNITSATDVVAAQTTVGETPGDAPQVEDVPEDENFRLVLKTLLGGLQLSFVATTGDTLMDVRQFLTEASETCFYTHYILRHDGVELNDFVEVSTLVERTPEGPVVNLVMAEGLYEDRTVRMHVRRLREILEPPKVTPGSAAFLLLPSVQDGALVSSPLDKTLDVTALETEEEQKGPMTSACHLPAIFDFDFGVPMPPKDPQCLKSVTLSPLNPPPPHRLLHGDLVYLDVVLCDDRACVVTATARGFYVNCTPSTGATRVLNPERDTASTLSYTLVGLLNQLSPAFKRNIVKLMVAHASRDPLEAIAHQSVISPWVVAPRDAHAPDPHRLEDWVANAYGMEGGTISRDWNEEQQSCRELAKDTPRDATLRQRTIFKITADFVEAATKGAVAVIDRCIPPINPMDPTAAQMYVYNSIFFSFAADRPPNAPDGVGHTPSEIPEGAPSGKPEGAGRGEVSADVESALAEQTSYASSNADLVGVRHFSRTDTDGLYTLATALVDYRGSRVVAQSIIPGILQGEQLSSLIYGSVDGGQKVLWHEAFHEKLRAAAAPLHIKECTVVDGSGAEHKIAAPVDCKGIMGSDSRMYLLDLVRITPLDPAFEGDPRDGGLLRWELVHNFLRAKTAAAAADKPEKEVEMLTMNPNIMLSERTPAHAWTLSGEDLAGDEALIRECAASLALAVIPGLVHRFRALAVSPVDGRQLACEMHSEGVNMRYLGAVHAAAHQVPYVQHLCEGEMVARACKHLLRAGLTQTAQGSLAAALAHFLNCLFGRVSAPAANGKAANKGKKKGGGKSGGGADAADLRGPLIALGSDALWAALQADVARRFSFALADRSEVLPRVSRMPLLRAVAQRVGLQLLAKAYDLESAHPFTPDDIQGLQAVVKGTLHTSQDGQDLLNAGKAYLQEGDPQRAAELLHEGLSVLHQTCGPLHVQTAECYTALAMAYYHHKDAVNALACQQKGIAILERIHGWDDPDVALGYGNLALFSHSLQEHQRAVYYIKRAEQLLLTICGPNHPDVAALYINTAMVHLDLGHSKTALRYLHASLKIYESVLGEGHLQTATCFHATAVALSMMSASSLAVKNEQRCCDILKAHLDATDPRVVESVSWVRTFSSRAKLQAQQAPPPSANGAATPAVPAEPGGAETVKPLANGLGGPTEAEVVKANGGPTPGKARAGKGAKA